jgi:hypothetical protein
MLHGWGEDVCVQGLVEHQGKDLLGKPSRRWEDNIRMNLKGIDVMVWTGLD